MIIILMELSFLLEIHAYDHILINVDKNIKNRNLVTIIGEVNIPGKYIITNGMTIYDLLEISGGYTENADTNKIIIHNEILKFEEDLELNTISAQLLTGGLSSAIAILCFSYVHDYMNKKYKLLDLHVLQSIGLIIGTILIIILYNIIRGKQEEEENK